MVRGHTWFEACPECHHAPLEQSPATMVELAIATLQVAAAITTLLFQPVPHQPDDQAAGQRVWLSKLAIHLIEKEIIVEF